MAFHRLYQQINAEPGLGVVCGSLSPGMVDTAGVQDHVSKARALDLPHVKYFDEAYKQGSMTSEKNLMVMVQNLLEMDPDQSCSLPRNGDTVNGVKKILTK